MHVWIAWWLFLASLLVVGCSERSDDRLSPAPRADAEVAEAVWVTDRDEVANACAIARRNPLVQRLERELGTSRLSPALSGAALLRGTTTDARRIALTIVPHATGQDPTRATYVALYQSGDRAAASSWELIVGREPRADESDFYASSVGDLVVWLKEGPEIAAVPTAGRASVLLSTERWSRQKFMACFAAEMPSVRDLGLRLDPPGGSDLIRRTVETVGGAAVMISCAFKALF